MGRKLLIWKQEHIDALIEFNSAGNDARQTATAMGERFGRPFSRNAIIGKLARLRVQYAFPRIRSEKALKPTKHAAPKWTPEEDEILKKLFHQGRSFPEISAIVDRSPNACNNRANLLGLFRLRVKSAKPKCPGALVKRGNRLNGGTVATTIVQNLDWRPAATVSLLERKPSMCAFPVGDPKDDDFGCCGLPVYREGASYCANCYGIAYRPALVKKQVRLSA